MRIWTVAAGVLLVACGNPTVHRLDREIINGTIDESAAHDAVAALTDADGEVFCTGTYVGNQTIVTAAHCFDDAAPTYVYFGVDAVTDNLDCLDGWEEACEWFLYVDDYLVHPKYSAEAFDAGSDIAVVAIADDLPEIEPIPFLALSERTEFAPADEGTQIEFVGFGVTDGFNQTGSGIRRRTTGTLETLGPKSAQFEGETIALGEDQVFVRQAGTGTCQGDSGGPLLIDRAGRQFLGAVTSYGDDGCIGYGVSVTTDVHEDFIRQFYGPGDIPGEYQPGGEGGGGEGGDPGGGSNGGDSQDAGGGCTATGSPAGGMWWLCFASLVILGLRRRRSGCR